jgi:hypothetical protein
MDQKAYLIVLLVLIGACSSTPKKVPTQGSSSTTSIEEPSEPVDLPPSMGGVDIGDEPASPEEAPREPLRVGIWIEGAGVEAIAAIGFMQELHKAGVRPVKVVGTGFGCWTALSWALEDSPNQAEWQAFKWADWNALGMGSSLLSRISTSRNFSSFSKEMQKLLPKKEEFGELALDSDCPLARAKGDASLESGQSLGIYRALWEQMQLPLFKAEEPTGGDKNTWVSGLLASWPLPSELDEMARLRKSNGDVQAWILIKTSRTETKIQDRLWMHLLTARAERALAQAGTTPQGRKIWILDWSANLAPRDEDSRDFAQRRKYLLSGRERAQAFMHSSWYESNLKLSTPAP